MAAEPSAPTEGRVNYQERPEQNFQARHNQQLQNHGGSHQEFVAPQQFMGWQERYAEEEQQHVAHLRDVRLQNDARRQINYDREVLQHQAHLAELQRQREQQRQMEVLQHEAHLAELQRQREQLREIEHQAHLAEMQ